MLYCLVTIQPLHTSGERRTVRVASAGLSWLTAMNGSIWEPALTQPPVLRLTLFNGDFQAAADPGAASLPVNMKVLKNTFPWADECSWASAPVEIRVGAQGDAWPWRVAFKGKVSSFDRKGEILTISAEAALDDKDILTATYAGTEGKEGYADLKGKVKPLAIGWPRNVEPVLINAIDSVFQFSAYGPIEEVTTLYERGADMGTSFGDYANYAALVAASIPNGRWATCLAEGMIRLGAPPYGVITADIKGHKVGASTPRLSGSIISALATICGIDTAQIETATLTALDAAAPYPASLYLTEQTKFLDMARRLALPCNFQSGISLEGKFFVTAIGFAGAPSLTLHAQGKSWPQVIEPPVEQNTSAPYWRTVMGAARSWRVHSADEIAYAATLIEKGPYSNTETYREGNWVSLPDGSTWIYVNVTASSGNAPPAWPTTSNAWWQNRTPPGGTNATYSDGTPIDDLRPDEVGATNGAIVGYNIRDDLGTVLPPSELLNSLNPSLNFVGEFSTPPTQVSLGSAWKQNAVYKNSTNGKSYVLTGTPLAWQVYLEDGQLFQLTIESTNGTTFRVGQAVTTILKARLFKNGAEITDVTPTGWFRWRRVSAIPMGPPNDDATWNAAYAAGYRQVSVSVDDVAARATFFCDIISPT